jgi:hypothetical protein
MRALKIAALALLAAALAAEAFVPAESHFAVERIPAWNALYGFLACAALILVARAIGFVLKRPDTYYDE